MGWFSDLFGDNTSTTQDDSMFESSEIEQTEINPANGMPMVGGIGGVDIEGNPYGTDSDTFQNTIEDDFMQTSMMEDDDWASSSFSDDDSFSSFDDNF